MLVTPPSPPLKKEKTGNVYVVLTSEHTLSWQSDNVLSAGRPPSQEVAAAL